MTSDDTHEQMTQQINNGWTIDTDEDLERAFVRLDDIWDALPGDSCFEERERLVDAIEAYETKNVFIEPPSEVEAALFRFDQECIPSWCCACHGPYHPATGHILTSRMVLCGPCAISFCQWLKARMGSMDSKSRIKATGERNSESFYDAAAKSIIGD